MDQQLEKHLKEMTKDDFRKILDKLEIDVKTTDTDTLEQEERYQLYKAELEKKFAETGIEITTVDELKVLEEAGNLSAFKTEIAKQKAEVNADLTPPESTDTVNNTDDFEAIDKGIAELKTMATELTKLNAELKDKKETMTGEEILAKKKEIKDKKAAIDTKRKAIQALIDKIKKTWKDMDIDAIEDPNLKAELKKQKDEEEKKLSDKQKEMDAIEMPGNSKLNRDRDRVKRNPVATGGIVLGAGLLIAWIAGAFKKKKKKTEDGEGGDKEEKKGFWQSGLGMAIKVVGFGGGAYYIIHGFVTGRWNLKDFFDRTRRGADNHNPALDQVESYVERAEKNPEQKEKYESFGTNVDTYYETVFANELSNGREDDGDMSTIPENVAAEQEGDDIDTKMKGVVPYCIDNSFSSVDSILSEKGIELDLLSKDITEVKAVVLGWIKSAIGPGLISFLSILPSFITGGTGATTEEKVENWMNTGKPEDRIKELRFFFRQQLRVVTYLNEKKEELRIKIAQDKLNVNNPEGFESAEEALEDEDRVEKEIDPNADYVSFMDGGILNAVDIMRKRDIFDAKVDQDVQDVVDEVDGQRDEILDGKNGEDILTRCETDMSDDGKLETVNSIVLIGSCRKIINDITEEIEGPLEESAWNIYEDLAASQDSQMRQILKESPFLEAFRKIKQGMEDVIVKLQNGTFTKEDLVSIKKVINEYFAFKKEFIIGANIFEKVKDENGNVVIRFGKFMVGCLTNIFTGIGEIIGGDIREGLGYILAGGAPIFTVVAGFLYLKKGKNRVKMGTALSKVPGKINTGILLTAKVINGKYVGSASILRKKFFNTVTGPDDLVAAIRGEKISLRKAAQIVNDGANNKWIFDSKVKSYRSAYKGYNNIDNIKDLLIQKTISLKTTRAPGELKLVREYFDTKTRGKLVRSSSDDTIALLKNYDKIPSDKKIFFNKILDAQKLTKADIQKLIDHADDIDISKLETSDLDRVAKKVAKQISKASNADDINDLIKNEINVVEAANDLTAAQDACKVKLESEISVLKKQLRGATNIESLKIQSNIDELKNIIKDIKNFPDDEIKALKKVIDTGMDVKYISKILSVDDPATLLKNIDKAANVTEFDHQLRFYYLNDFADELKRINKMDDFFSEFKLVATKLDDVVDLLKAGNKITDAVKAISKLPI